MPAPHSHRQSSPGVTLLEASRQLQARHMAAGFYPARSANEMFYVHEMVDWYRWARLWREFVCWQGVSIVSASLQMTVAWG